MATSVREQLEELNEACKEFCEDQANWVGAAWRGIGPQGTPNFRLLYSSPETLKRQGGVMLLGTNPGGGPSNADRYHPDVPFLSPTYSSYLDDSWGDFATGQHPMQLAARAVARTIAGNRPRGDRLLRNSPTGNLIPFRSEKPSDLPDLAVQYGLDFGWQLIAIAQPRVLVLLVSNTQRWEWLMERVSHDPEPDRTLPITKTLILREAQQSEGKWPRYIFALPALNTGNPGQNANVIGAFRQRVDDIGRDTLLADAGEGTWR